MTRTLYIAEKPSVARAIADELGVVRREDGSFVCRGDVNVTWCFGHLLEQAEPDAYLPDGIPKTRKGTKIWRFEDLPIFPDVWKSVPRRDRGVAKQLKTIGRLLRESDRVVHAGDPDREGQLLVDEVLEHFRCRLPVARFWVSAVDPASIRKGLAALKENRAFAGMRDAARGRSRADWLLGMNLSRCYTLEAQAGARGTGGKPDRGPLIAVGRVQTPTLAMVARRDYAVEHFVPVPYLAITAELAAQGTSFTAKWRPKKGQPGLDADGKLLLDLDLGRKLVERLAHETTATVRSAETKRRKAFPPKPYTLADIQIEASRTYGFGADETLKVCQALYEKHKITSYPRTDCGYLPESQHPDAPQVLEAVARNFPEAARAVSRANPAIKSPVWNDKKVTAHHGIVPVANTVDPSALSDAERKLYRLIARRYVAQFFPAHEYDATEIVLDIGGEAFVAKGKTVVVKGWKVLYPPARPRASSDGATDAQACAGAELGRPKRRSTGEKSDETPPEDEQTLPALAAGDPADVLAVKGREDQTKPPEYFTEGTLIAAMENIWRSFDDPHIQEKLKEAGGIGTPATRAAIIQELKRKTYLRTAGKHLHCTEAGRTVLLAASPKVRSAAMTAAFETKLKLVEAGELPLDAFVAEYEEFIRREIAGERSKGSGGRSTASP